MEEATMLKTILACALGAAGLAPLAALAQAQGYPTPYE
jgi:hypothetical protein